MNILKDIKIKGDIFSEYAFLSYTFFFESYTETKADFSFVLPKNSLISSLKLFYNNKIIQTKIASASHTAMALNSDDAFLTLRKVRGNEYILTIDNIDEGGLTLLLSVYAPIYENRLSLPLAKKGGVSGIATHTAEVTLNLLDAENVISPTHQISVLENKSISTGRITADRDFAIVLSYNKNISSGILQKGISGGEALFKLYPKNPVFPDKKLMLIYDRENISSKASSVMARDFIFYTAKNYDGLFAVSISENLITDGFVKKADDVLDLLLDKLKDIDSNICTAPLMDIDDDTVIVLLTENPDAYKKAGLKNLYSVSFGTSSLSGYHIYPGENIELRAEDIIKNILYCQKIESLPLTASNGEAVLIDSSLENGVLVYIKYTGKFPEKLFLSNNGYTEEYPLENIKVYDSFSPIGLVCAEAKQRLLYQKLLSCSPDEISSIRKELEDTGLKYSVLNSETALIASLEKKSAPLCIVIPSDADTSSISTVSMFKEHTSTPDEAVLFRSVNYIIKNLRADGAICTDGEINQDIRKRLSKICLAALYIKDSSICLKKTEDFLSFRFENKRQAIDFLLSVFKEDTIIPKELDLDLLTASKIILKYATGFYN